MESNFWHAKWEANELAFHASETNPLLITYFKKLSLEKGSRIFLPLCGKTLDISWLLSYGYRVVGAELSKLAIEQLFAELGVVPTISIFDNLDHYSATNIDIFVGDIFNVTGEILGQIDAVYDRAALVALPEATRVQYSHHLTNITDTALQLLICYEYDQSLQAGPPFSVSNEEVNQHYNPHYNLRLLASENLEGGLKGKCAATENVWLLKQK